MVIHRVALHVVQVRKSEDAMPEVTVMQGKTKCTLSFTEGSTYKDLKVLVAEELLVEPAHQKLIVKGKTPGDGEGVKGGEKIMLMLSEAGHKQMKANEDEAAKKVSPPRTCLCVPAQIYLRSNWCTRPTP
jgi:hypothetical protein